MFMRVFKCVPPLCVCSLFTDSLMPELFYPSGLSLLYLSRGQRSPVCSQGGQDKLGRSLMYFGVPGGTFPETLWPASVASASQQLTLNTFSPERREFKLAWLLPVLGRSLCLPKDQTPSTCRTNSAPWLQASPGGAWSRALPLHLR